MNKAIADVTAERLRQVQNLGWDAEHDDGEHYNNELAKASAALAILDSDAGYAKNLWPWDDIKDKGHRNNCVRAAALLIAEIERLDRLPQTTSGVKAL